MVPVVQQYVVVRGGHLDLTKIIYGASETSSWPSSLPIAKGCRLTVGVCGRRGSCEAETVKKLQARRKETA